MEGFSQENGKQKKQKQKTTTKATKKNYKNDRDSIIEIFLKMSKLKKEKMLTLEIN